MHGKMKKIDLKNLKIDTTLATILGAWEREKKGTTNSAPKWRQKAKQFWDLIITRLHFYRQQLKTGKKGSCVMTKSIFQTLDGLFHNLHKYLIFANQTPNLFRFCWKYMRFLVCNKTWNWPKSSFSRKLLMKGLLKLPCNIL